MEVHFLQLADVGDIRPVYVFKPADGFNTAFFCCRKHGFQNVEIAVIGSARVLQNRVFVVLRVRSGEVSAVKIGVIFLLAVIWQRLSWHLAACYAAAISKNSKEKSVDSSLFLNDIESLFRSFVYKRHCPDLYSDHVAVRTGRR